MVWTHISDIERDYILGVLRANSFNFHETGFNFDDFCIQIKYTDRDLALIGLLDGDVCLSTRVGVRWW